MGLNRPARQSAECWFPPQLCNVTLGPSALGQHYTTSGHNFSVLTSAPVNNCMLFFWLWRLYSRSELGGDTVVTHSNCTSPVEVCQLFHSSYYYNKTYWVEWHCWEGAAGTFLRWQCIHVCSVQYCCRNSVRPSVCQTCASWHKTKMSIYR